MRVVCDIETNALENPTQIWVIVCKDIDEDIYHVFRRPTQDLGEKRRFLQFARQVTRWIGHNFLDYDYPILDDLCGLRIDSPGDTVHDTLLISRLVEYSRPDGHSIEAYGEEFGTEKIEFSDWSQYSHEMEAYCIRDVDICHNIYAKFFSVVHDAKWAPAIKLEHDFQIVVNALHRNGFSFNTRAATSLLEKVTGELTKLDRDILEAFPRRLKPIRRVVPRATKYGTISLASIPVALRKDITQFSVGAEFDYCHWVDFNPSSHKQLVDVLHNAGWKPIDKTTSHIAFLRGKNSSEEDHEKHLKYGWKVNENNLNTLPASAPAPARFLAQRILYESRRRTLTEWLALVHPDGRVRGKFLGIGAWTHRMAHQKPNTANIPNSVHISTGLPKLLGSELRSLWQAPRNRLLVGVDAEAIQLRIFAHLINDPELTNAIVNGKKSKGTDPHSLNRKVFGKFCKTRNAAKHSLYAIFFGGRANKISQIMACTKEEAEVGIHNLIARYPGLARLEEEVFPQDAKRGYFIGLDGRQVQIPGNTISERKHLCMSGYLQNGEKVVMAKASVKFHPQLKKYNSLLVALVHDEWQTETPNNMEIALAVAKLQADSLREVGEELGLNCPLAGSYWSDDNDDYTIGTNWTVTH